MARIKSVTGKKAATAVTAKPAAARVIRTAGNKAAATRPARGLFFYHKVPQGNVLRAYMLALITAQCGSIKPNVAFRVWPYANLGKHVGGRRLKKIEKDTYALTAEGATFFADSAEKVGKDNIAAMVKAVQSGVAPAFYNYQLSTMQKPAA